MNHSKGKKLKKREKEEPIRKGLRWPRPLGTTYMAKQLLTTQENNKGKIRERLLDIQIEKYINDGLLNEEGRPIPISELQIYLGIENRIEILRRINRRTNRMMELSGDKDYIMKIAGEVTFRALNLSLEGYAKASNQANILSAAQGKKYVPFLTGAVNQAIGNLTAAQRPIFEIAKMLQEMVNKNGLQGDNPTTNNFYMSPDEAIKVAGNNKESLLNDNKLLQEKFDELNSIEGLPNISATDDLGLQKGKKLLTNSHTKYVDKMALKYQKRGNNNQAINNNKRPDNLNKTHTNHRQLEEDIIDYEDMPKI